MRADQNKNRGTRVIFFSWGRVGSVRGLFWGILLCELIKLDFPDLWIHAYAYTSKLHLRYATVLQVHVIIIVLKMFIYMYLHEDVILLFKGLTVTKVYLHFAFNKLVEMKCRHSKTN